MGRNITEPYIDRWFANIKSLSDLHVAEQAIKKRMDHIHYTVRPTHKQKWRKEYQCLVLLSQRINLVLPAFIENALEDQRYLALPEEEKCGINRYRYLSRFIITPANLNLIEGYGMLARLGWYHSTNNTSGVVRDHMVSIHYGWKNRVPAETIGHIANCQLIPYRDNAKKSSECCMTMKELEKKIKRLERRKGDV